MSFSTVILRVSLLICLASSATDLCAQTSNVPKGTVIVQGGGDISLQRPEMWEKFISLAGGPDANFIFIPTADEPVDMQDLSLDGLPFGKLKHVQVLHTRCRSEADSETFVASLRKANGVWFGAGRTFRLADAYLHTKLQNELQRVLDRGGVVGGFSAGGMMLGSYVVRGDILDDKKLMADGYEEGFGYLKNIALDQRIDTRKRVDDMIRIVTAYPKLLGIGLEESTAIIVRNNEIEVIGPGRVAVTDGKPHDGNNYYYLRPGDKLGLEKSPNH